MDQASKAQVRGSYFCALVVFQVTAALLQCASFGLLTFVRAESNLILFQDVWFVAYAIVTLVAINAGSFVLCFRRRKYVCLFFCCELASLVLFSY